MVHMALACNILNAIGGSPVLADPAVVPTYPGPLPYDIGAVSGDPFVVSLLPFSEAAMRQATRIEEPDDPLLFPDQAVLARDVVSFETIGEFYRHVDEALRALPAGEWSDPPRNQLGDHPFFPGELFAVTGYESAALAIQRIVSEGEGTTKGPQDFEGDVAHYYRFEELRRDQALQRDPGVAEGYSWGPSLGVAWNDVEPAITDPSGHDFAGDPPALAAQDACDGAFTVMVHELHRGVNGEPGRIGKAVRAMFDLRMAARAALATILRDSDRSAGPAFRYRPDLM
jgi:hypothetical protein